MADKLLEMGFDKNPNLTINEQAPVKKSDKEVDPKKDWTTEEIDDLAKATLKSFGIDEPEEKEKKPKEPAAKDPEKKTEKGEAKKPEDKSKEPVKTEKVEDRIASRVAEANADLVAKLAEKQQQRETDAKKPQETQGLFGPEKVAKDLEQREVLEFIKSRDLNSSQIVQEFDDFLSKEEAYAKSWLKENPGEEFVRDSDDHEEWYETNEPKYDQSYYNRSEARMIAEKVADERELKASNKQTIDRALSSAEASISQISEAFEADIGAKLTEKIGENTILAEKGPVSEKLNETMETLGTKIRETSMLLTPGTKLPFNEKNPVHLSIQKSIYAFDAEIESMTEEQQSQLVTTALGKKSNVAGRKFASMEKFRSMTDAEQRSSWSIAAEPEMASKLMAAESGAQFSGWLDQLFTQLGTKTGDPSASKVTQDGPGAGEGASGEDGEKPKPPSVGASAGSVSPQDGEKAKGDNSWESIGMNFG